MVVGSINADLGMRVARHPKPGETLLGAGGGITPGGKGANQALAASLQGADVTMIGAVGSDPYAAPATALLRKSGVNLDAVATTEETTGLAVIAVADDGENTIIFIPGANATVTAERVQQHAEVLAGAEITLLQGEVPAAGFAAATKLAGGRVVVNLAPVIEVPREALLRADPIMANEHEAGLILEQLGVQAASEDPRDLATALLDTGFASVVLTLGARGALVATPAAITDIPTPEVTAVDTTGAGDAFAGAFAARLLVGDDMVTAARHAARVGALTTTAFGAQSSYPDLSVALPKVEKDISDA